MFYGRNNNNNKKKIEIILRRGEKHTAHRQISIEVSKIHKFCRRRFVERQHLGMSSNIIIHIYLRNERKIKSSRLLSPFFPSSDKNEKCCASQNQENMNCSANECQQHTI